MKRPKPTEPKRTRIIADLIETRRKRKLRCDILAHGLAETLKDCWDTQSLIDLAGAFAELRTEAELLLNAENTLSKLSPNRIIRRRRP
jgi:hypothetical protein